MPRQTAAVASWLVVLQSGINTAGEGVKHGADIGISDTTTSDFANVAKGSVKSIFEATLLRNP